MDTRRLKPHLLGGGRYDVTEDGTIHLSIPPTASGYADAQLDDYQELHRAQFPWTAPLTLKLRARASHAAPPGTLGFGFWNDPFGVSLSGAGSLRRFPAAPQAVWFFYGSPPNDFSFVRGGGIGDGWKAAVLRSVRYPAAILIPGAAAAFTLGNLPLIRRWFVPLVRRQAMATEVALTASLIEWHEYSLIWQRERIEFKVDEVMVAESSMVPHAPLGFVTWIDNQFAVLSEARGIRFGLLPTNEEHWLEIRDLQIERL